MRPEVVFLDIHMPKVDGFQFLGMLDPDVMPLVVFVTAYDSPSIERITCISGHGIKLVDVAEIEFVRSSESGVHLVTEKGEFLTELTLTVLETKVPSLARCHKQVLVNLRQIDEILRQDASSLIRTRSGKLVPVSRRFLPQLKERLLIR